MEEEQVPRTVPVKGSEVILLVAEEETVREFAHMILETSGYVVLDARNERECLALCAGHQGPIHLLVTDLTTAEPGAPELAERALKLRPDLKVMFMSGHAEGAFPKDVVLKEPLVPVGLAERVREALHSSAPGRVTIPVAA